MELRSRSRPKEGDTRSRTAFLRLPKEINGERRWLEYASWQEQYFYDWCEMAWTDRKMNERQRQLLIDCCNSENRVSTSSIKMDDWYYFTINGYVYNKNPEKGSWNTWYITDKAISELGKQLHGKQTTNWTD